MSVRRMRVERVRIKLLRVEQVRIRRMRVREARIQAGSSATFENTEKQSESRILPDWEFFLRILGDVCKKSHQYLIFNNTRTSVKWNLNRTVSFESI